MSHRKWKNGPNGPHWHIPPIMPFHVLHRPHKHSFVLLKRRILGGVNFWNRKCVVFAATSELRATTYFPEFFTSEYLVAPMRKKPSAFWPLN